MLAVNNVTKKFKKNTAVNNFSFTFEDEIYGLLGPNGAGKTTLLRCMAGLYDFSGSIKENGAEILKLKENQRSIGYLPQKFGMFPNLTVTEMLEYFFIQKEVKIDKNAINEYIELVGLEEKAKSKVSSLSGGMVRRLGIAQALIGEPSLIIFDEPTAGLDPEERIRFKNIVSQLKFKSTVILSTHIVADVSALCEKIIIMDKGSIAFSGTPEETAALAENKIYIVDENDRDKIKGKHHVIETFSNGHGGSLLRIAASEKQDFEPAPAGVEDGYICCIRDI